LGFELSKLAEEQEISNRSYRQLQVRNSVNGRQWWRSCARCNDCLAASV